MVNQHVAKERKDCATSIAIRRYCWLAKRFTSPLLLFAAVQWSNVEAFYFLVFSSLIVSFFSSSGCCWCDICCCGNVRTLRITWMILPRLGFPLTPRTCCANNLAMAVYVQMVNSCAHTDNTDPARSEKRLPSHHITWAARSRSK